MPRRTPKSEETQDYVDDILEEFELERMDHEGEMRALDIVAAKRRRIIQVFSLTGLGILYMLALCVFICKHVLGNVAFDNELYMVITFAAPLLVMLLAAVTAARMSSERGSNDSSSLIKIAEFLRSLSG